MTDWLPFGYSHFCSKEEYSKVVQGLERDIDLSIDTGSAVKRMVISKEDLVPLPNQLEPRLVQHDQFEIFSVGQELAPVYLMSQRAGWNQTQADLTALMSQPDSCNLLATYEINGRRAPLGSGIVVDIGKSVGWISMLLVHSELRRQGIGLALLKQCLIRARIDLNKQVVGLDATPMGMPIYQNLGFQPSFKLWRCQIETDANMARFHPLDIDPISTMNDCRSLLSNLGTEQKLSSMEMVQNIYPEGCWIAKSNHTMTGLVLSRPGRQHPYIGPLLAVDIDTGKALLTHALNYWRGQGHLNCVLDIPEDHFATASFWENGECISTPEGFELTESARPIRVLTRMYELPNPTSPAVASNFPNDSQYLKHLQASAPATRKYKNSELAGLKFLYSSAGPEIG